MHVQCELLLLGVAHVDMHIATNSFLSAVRHLS